MVDEEVYISKLSDFMEYVENLEEGFIMSRGQSAPYKLLPSAMREDATGNRIISKRTVQYYLDEFKINSYQFMNRPWDINSDLEWMIYAQHYGIPTNLLDFSKSHIISLLFAVEKAFETENHDDGVVFFLNPFRLNNKHVRRSEIITTIDNTMPTSDGPYVIQGRKLNIRIQAQDGLFVKFDDSDKNLDSLVDESILKKILIKQSDKKQILSSIFTMGLGFSSIYPELSYVSKDILMRKNVNDFIKEEL